MVYSAKPTCTPVRVFDTVPHTEVCPALSHHNVTARHPLHVLAKTQQAAALLALQVIQMQLVVLVTEQQVAATQVQLLWHAENRQAAKAIGGS